MINIILIACIFIIIILLSIIISNKTKIKEINILLDEFLNNSSRRITINNSQKDIANMVNKLNKILNQSQEINIENEKQNLSIKRMISNISHDFKTPLTSMIGYMQLIKEDEQINKDELKEYINIVYDKATFLNKTLQNFFYLSKVQADDEKFKIQQINLSEIIREQVIFYYEDFKKINISPEINMPEEDIMIYADKSSLSRIINNLLSNSIKYGNDGGKIGINLYKEAKETIIEVWDNGKGINEEHIPYIFDRLYTVEESRNPLISSSGLGLSIVKELVKKNGGKILVKSIPYEKTSFILKI